MSKNKKYIVKLTSSGTSDPSCKEREEARVFLHHQNLPGLPTVHLGKCSCIRVKVKQQYIDYTFFQYLKCSVLMSRCEKLCDCHIIYSFPPQPCFDMFYNHVKKLFSSDATLTHMEKCSLMEALVLISNQFKDFAKQKAFLDELMASVVADWTSDEMRQCV